MYHKMKLWIEKTLLQCSFNNGLCLDLDSTATATASVYQHHYIPRHLLSMSTSIYYLHLYCPILTTTAMHRSVIMHDQIQFDRMKDEKTRVQLFPGYLFIIFFGVLFLHQISQDFHLIAWQNDWLLLDREGRIVSFPGMPRNHIQKGHFFQW